MLSSCIYSSISLTGCVCGKIEGWQAGCTEVPFGVAGITSINVCRLIICLPFRHENVLGALSLTSRRADANK